MKSGLQKEVLALYRRALRMVRTKPESARSRFRLYMQYTFHNNAKSISPRNVSAIEHLLRKGKRQIEMYEDPAVTQCFVSQAMRDWQATNRVPPP
ncbi:hypothetical protein FA13DRAFT_1630461 [Coprinellus micaceus]|uniref:Complex 1 LYR protein domain-containing protein n=1 Tax=Coprinellus micaceus TaxID=71717 RepID=A0A4Y7T8Z9_COPMI|nr:hypothetical protein FA13DRAFT_1630461 [Coprinellus micaceus]